jgi:flagellar hook-basal body complex protein FliE
MNPLSAINMGGTPDIRSLMSQLPNTQPAAIPLDELKTLQPSAEALRPAAQSLHLGTAGPTGGFGQVLGDLVQGVNAKQNSATDAVNGLISGDGVSLHQAMIAMEEASVSFQLMVEVRNKLLESYQEVMRMQI